MKSRSCRRASSPAIPEVISLRNGYHGGTQATMALTAHSTWKFKTNPTVSVKNALAPYCYRCPYGLEYPSCGLKCAHDVENVIKYETSGQVACFIGEPIQGVGGARHTAAGVFQNRVRHRSQSRRPVHRRRSASRLRPHRRTFLGLRKLRRHARHGHDGQRHRQRHPAGGLRHAAGNRAR